MTRTSKTTAKEPQLTIGGLSRATGIPVATLRTWERRHGFPDPVRKPSSHRLYALPAVGRLKRIRHALGMGLRAAEVVALAPDELERLIAAAAESLAAERPSSRVPTPSVPDARERLASVPGYRAELEWVLGFDRAPLVRFFRERYAALGPLEFVIGYAGPLMVAVGEAWRAGSLEVRHEHFVSGRLADFLREARQPFDDLARGPLVAATTLPGETHEVGLLMACLVFAMEDRRVLYLGPGTPPGEIVSLAREATIGAVALSFARGSQAGARQLAALRRSLPPRTALYAGGAGAPQRVSGVHQIADLSVLQQELRGARTTRTTGRA